MQSLFYSVFPALLLCFLVVGQGNEEEGKEETKIFTSQQIEEIQLLLDSASEKYASNLTAIEETLQAILLEETVPRSDAKNLYLTSEEMKNLHQKLETVGQLLRETFDYKVTGDQFIGKMQQTSTASGGSSRIHWIISATILLIMVLY